MGGYLPATGAMHLIAPMTAMLLIMSESGVTVAEAAAALQCSESTVHRKIRAGELVARRSGPRLVKVDRLSLQAFIGKSLTGGQGDASKEG